MYRTSEVTGSKRTRWRKVVGGGEGSWWTGGGQEEELLGTRKRREGVNMQEEQQEENRERDYVNEYDEETKFKEEEGEDAV